MPIELNKKIDIMNEKDKLTEAGYFYSHMINESDNSKHFAYELHAFLSSTRSVLQYALEEAKSHTKGQRWYDEHMGKSKILSFFTNERNLDIHTRPVKPAKDVTTFPPPTTSCLSMLAPVIHTDASGDVIEERGSTPETVKSEFKKQDRLGTSITEYRFIDWQGNEDAITLCQMYLDELKQLVEEGIKVGFLTG